MIVTEGPKLDEKLKKVTPWWDVITKYLIAAMTAIALTSIAVQVTKDNLICVPAIECSNLTNSSDDAAKLCQSLTPKSLNKKVLEKMVDRRFYDYVDSVCFHQKLSQFAKFFSLILLGEAVLLLVFDIMWTTLPFSSSVLNHFETLTDEGYSSLATVEFILGEKIEDRTEKNTNTNTRDTDENTSKSCCNIPLLTRNQGDQGKGKADVANTTQGNSTPSSTSNQANDLQKMFNIPDADVLKVLNLVKKAKRFRDSYNRKKSLCNFYVCRISLQFLTCLIFFAVNLCGCLNVFGFSDTLVHFKCVIDDILFTKEYDHFECSHPLAPYFQIALILFLISLGLHCLISFYAIFKICRSGRSYTFPKKSGDTSEQSTSEQSNDFAFLFHLLNKHDKLYADRVSYFFRHETHDDLPGNILTYMSKK